MNYGDKYGDSSGAKAFLKTSIHRTAIGITLLMFAASVAAAEQKPPGMEWIPGEEFSMRSDDFTDAQ